MFITLQYTLTDTRRFDSSPQLLQTPDWPDPIPYIEFVRGSGQIIPKKPTTVTHLGTTSISEHNICKIKKGIKILKQQTVPELKDLIIENRYKNYFSDGGVLSKFEFVFHTKSNNQKYNYGQLQIILNRILAWKISIRNRLFGYTNY